MAGVDAKTKGGMWSVAQGYLQDVSFAESAELFYIPMATCGDISARIVQMIRGLCQFWYICRTQHPEVAHLHVSERGSVLRKGILSCCAKWFGCKVILHLHGAEFEAWYTALSEKKKARVRRVLDSADRILILGEYWRGFIESLVQTQEKVCVLHNAVDCPGRNMFQPEAKNILFLGEIGKRKGAYDLLEAFKNALPLLPESVRLVMYGPNPDGTVQQRISEMRLDSRVEYRGWLDVNQRSEVLCNVALCVLPSYHEGLPMTILETMAMGIPNISTKVAAIPEVIDEDSGVLIQPGDVETLSQMIVYLMNDDEKRRDMSRHAYEKVRLHFSRQRHVERLLEVYSEILK